MPTPLVMLLLCAPAQTPDVFEARPLAIEAHLGLGTPVGVAGVAVDYALLRWLSLNAGVGIGASGLPPQLSLLGRARVASGMGLGAGLSLGPYEWNEGGILAAAVDDGAKKRWEQALWANGEVSYEYRGTSGFVLRPYAGAGVIINNGSGECTSNQIHCRVDHPNGGRFLFFTGMSLGFAFSA